MWNFPYKTGQAVWPVLRVSVIQNVIFQFLRRLNHCCRAGLRQFAGGGVAEELGLHQLGRNRGAVDPHKVGRLAGAHGVIIPKRRAVGLTATVARTSAGALNYTPVAKVTNMAATIEDLKKRGIWFVCADMGGESMYRLNLTGPIGLVIGNEGEGVSRLVKEKCDMIASIPMKGDIDSLNASVATGVLAYEIVRQRLAKA